MSRETVIPDFQYYCHQDKALQFVIPSNHKVVEYSFRLVYTHNPSETSLNITHSKALKFMVQHKVLNQCWTILKQPIVTNSNQNIKHIR